MKTVNRRRRFLLGVESSFFPRARKALQDRLRAQEKPGAPSEPRQKAMWEILAEETPAAGTPAGPPPAGAPPAAERPEMMRPGFQPRGYTRVDPNQWFDVPAMWTFVDQTRRSPGYNQSPFLIDILTRPVQAKEESQRQAEALGEIAQFFGIPASAFQGLSIDQAWTQVIGPIFEEFEQIMNRMKPEYISGHMRFDLSPQNELAVVYYER